MSVSIKQFLTDKRLPKFLVESKSLNACKSVSKVFPGIGLPNCQKEIKLDNRNFAYENGIALWGLIARELSSYYLLTAGYLRPSLNAAKRTQASRWACILQKVYDVVAYLPEEIVLIENGKISLKLRQDVIDNDKILFHKGESLFKVYNKLATPINALKCGHKLRPLETTDEFKSFSVNNIPSNNFSIVFSSDGVDGLWDITTMSMRGIKSCQSWDGQYKANLVGSIVDPFTGIIYLTSGTKFNEYGSKMIKRCIVRLVVRSDTKKPFLMLDRMYPEQDNEILNKFISLLKEKTNNKFEIVTYYKAGSQIVGGSYIPETKNIKKINTSNLSFRDTKFCYGRPKDLDKAHLLNKKLLSKENRFLQLVNKEAFNAFDKLDHSKLVKSKKQTVLSILNENGFKYLLNKYYKDLAHKVIDQLPLSGDECSLTDYYNKLLYHFLSNRRYIESKQLAQFVRHINSYYKLSKVNKLRSKDLADTISVMNEHISSAVKEDLKKNLLKQLKASQKNTP